MTTPVFSDEVQLAGWSDSHNSGAKVTFWLNDPAKLEAFRGLTERKGKTAGQRLAMVLVEIGDDEQPVEPSKPAEIEKEKPGPLCMLAVAWCKDNKFQDWLFEKLAISGWQMSPVTSEETTKNNLCLLLGIQSRREIDTNPEAAMRFQTLIRLPYMQYQQTGKVE